MTESRPTVKVWDRVVRLGHWTLVASIALAWLSTIAARATAIGTWHQPVGYVTLAVVLVRVAWGLVGTNPYARFAQFVRAPRATWVYARAVLAKREPRYLGHNPLGAWMIVALMACVIGLALTGWLYTTDRLWGNETVEAIHAMLAWALLALAALHVAGVALTSMRHRENLVRAMFSGTKVAPREGDIA
jgi:cytochrome b